MLIKELLWDVVYCYYYIGFGVDEWGDGLCYVFYGGCFDSNDYDILYIECMCIVICVYWYGLCIVVFG